MNYTFLGSQTEGIDHGELTRTLHLYREQLADVVAHKRTDAPEAALASLVDETQRAFAHTVADTLGPVTQVVVIGIGGSSVGVEAVYRALEGSDSPVLHVIDVLDHEQVEAVAHTLIHTPLEQIAICVISKSGSTAETLANADVLMTLLRPTFGEGLSRRVVCIGDCGTKLDRFASERGMHFVEMPKMVGGRYSIFTVVGLVPLALLRVPIDELLAGGISTLLELAPQEGEEVAMPALQAALVRVVRMRTGDRVNVLFAEHERLMGCVKWYEQLLAESLGKETVQNGVSGVTGMVPVPMSPRELHSTAQLFLSGFPGVYTIFLGARTSFASASLTTSGFGGLIEISGARQYERVRSAITEGVRAAYATHRRPHVCIDLAALSPHEIGSFMACAMIEVMYTAHTLSIDAFDQPHVELYKKETRRILQS